MNVDSETLNHSLGRGIRLGERRPTSDCKESPFNLVRFRETAERNHGHLVLRGVATREADRSAHAFPCNNATQPKKLV